MVSVLGSLYQQNLFSYQQNLFSYVIYVKFQHQNFRCFFVEYFFYKSLACRLNSTKDNQICKQKTRRNEKLSAGKVQIDIKRFLKIVQRSVNLFGIFNLVRHSNNATLSTPFAKSINTPLAQCQHAPLSTHRLLYCCLFSYLQYSDVINCPSHIRAILTHCDRLEEASPTLSAS